MLTLVTGLPGNGKTLYTIWHLKNYLEAENKKNKKQGKQPREIYYHNIVGLTLDWKSIDDIKEWNSLPTGSIIVVDEAQTFFPPMQNGSVRPPFYTDFATHRHKGYDIFLITQNSGLIDFKVRSMVGEHIHLTRSMGISAATVYTFPTVQNTSNDWYKKADNVIKKQWKFPKEIFNYYKSAEVHTHKLKLPWFKFLLIGLAILFVVVMVFLLYSKLKPDNFVPEPTVQTFSNEGLEVLSKSSQKYTVDDLTPAIAGVPSSAPIYRSLFTVAAAPRVDGCSLYRFGKNEQCTCNDQRGNFVATPYAFCKAFVDNGFFDFTITDEQANSAKGADGVAPRVSITDTFNDSTQLLPF